VNINQVEAVFAEKTLWEYFRILLRRWKLVVLIFLFGLSVGVVVTMQTPETYRTETVLSPSNVDRPSGFFPVELVDNPKAQMDSFTGQVSMKIVTELLKSHDTRRLVVKALDLHEHYEYREEDGIGGSVKKLGSLTSIQLGKDEGILYLFVEDRDPHMAVAIAKSYVEVLSIRNTQLHLTSEPSLVRVLDNPFLPYSRYRPSYKLNLIVALLASGILTFLLCILLEVRSVVRQTSLDDESAMGQAT